MANRCQYPNKDDMRCNGTIAEDMTDKKQEYILILY
jgi:hypothetical protein